MRPALLVSLCFLACGAPQQTRRTFPVEVAVATPNGPLESGWLVRELSGELALDGVTFFEGEGLARFWPAELFVSSALAHPGHFAPGEAKAELLTPLLVDLSGGAPTTWGDASAVTGAYGSARLSFGAMGARLAGVALRDGVTVRFDTGVKVFSAPIEGLPFVHQMTTAPGLVRLTVDLSVVLARIDFERHQASPDAAGVVTFSPASPAFNGFDRGLTDAAAFRFTWQSN